MEPEDPQAWGRPLLILNEESGSAYEESDEVLQSSSQDDEPKIARASTADLTTPTGRNRTRSGKGQGFSREASVSDSDSDRFRECSTASQREERRRAAEEWALTFEPPKSPADISSPVRHAAGTQSKRKAVKPPSEVRAKRLKSWYNNDYRELLNIEIHDAVAGSVSEDQGMLEESQIGCSVWTETEKDLFFSALSRLGKDNVREIASRIGTKSEPEVQEYIQILHQGMLGKSNRLLGLIDLPAAIEISDECCGLLQRAGDALASRQERAEEEAEQEEWGDLWLLDATANKSLETQQKDQAGENYIEELLPAANFFHAKNWLELSQRVFMNADVEEDNWETIAEDGETPAIRATAFEDCHALVISFTKRLIATTMFCTMSRQRATGAKPVKHAEINQDDVEAAVNILGLKVNNQEFWRKCARRCKLKIFDEEWNSFMSYEEVEKALPEIRRQRSRSRSVSRAAQSETDASVLTDSPLISEDYRSDDSLHGFTSDFPNSPSDSDSDLTGYMTEGEAASSKSRKERLLQKARAKKDVERANQKYVETFDQEASRGEEQRLWTLLRQTAPFNVKPEPRELPEQPKGVFRDKNMETSNWRDSVHFRSVWETMDTPVLKERFDRNRRRISRRVRRRAERDREKRALTSAADSEDEVNEPSAGESNEENQDDGNAQEHLAEEEDDQEHGNEEGREESAIDSGTKTDQAHPHVQDDISNHNENLDEEDELHDRQVSHGDEHIDSSDLGHGQSPITQSPMSVDGISEDFQDASSERSGSDGTPMQRRIRER